MAGPFVSESLDPVERQLIAGPGFHPGVGYNSETLVKGADLAVALGCRLVEMATAEGRSYRSAGPLDTDPAVGYYGGVRVKTLARLCVGPQPADDAPEQRAVECVPAVMVMGGRTKPVNAPLRPETPAESVVAEREFYDELEQLAGRYPLVRRRLGLIGAPQCEREEVSRDTAEGIAYLVEYAQRRNIKTMTIVTDHEHSIRTYAMLLAELRRQGQLSRTPCQFAVLDCNAVTAQWDHDGVNRLAIMRAMFSSVSDERYWYRMVRLRQESLGMLALGLGIYGEMPQEPRSFNWQSWRDFEVRHQAGLEPQFAGAEPFDDGTRGMMGMLEKLGERPQILTELLEYYARNLPQVWIISPEEPGSDSFTSLRLARAISQVNAKFWHSPILFPGLAAVRRWPMPWYDNAEEDPGLVATNFLDLWLQGFKNHDSFEPKRV